MTYEITYYDADSDIEIRTVIYHGSFHDMCIFADSHAGYGEWWAYLEI